MLCVCWCAVELLVIVIVWSAVLLCLGNVTEGLRLALFCVGWFVSLLRVAVCDVYCVICCLLLARGFVVWS